MGVVDSCLQVLKKNQKSKFRIFRNQGDFNWLCKMAEVPVEDLAMAQQSQDSDDRHYIEIEIQVSDVKQSQIGENQILPIQNSQKFQKVEKMKQEADAEFKAGKYDQCIKLYNESYKFIFKDEGPV